MSDNNSKSIIPEPEKAGFAGYASLIFAILFFSGILGEISKSSPQLAWIGGFDFIMLSGKFGSLGTLAEGGGTLAANFRGTGGAGPRDAFLYMFTLAPQVIFALGVVKIIEDLGALKAAQALLTPVLRFILGIPGSCAVALVTSLQSTDAGASMVKALYDKKNISEKERIIFTSFQFSAAGTIVNYFAIGATVFALLEIPILIPLMVIVACKFMGANIVRFVGLRLMKIDENNGGDKA